LFLKHWYEGYKNYPDDYVMLDDNCQKLIVDKLKNTDFEIVNA